MSIVIEAPGHQPVNKRGMHSVLIGGSKEKFKVGYYLVHVVNLPKDGL